jgi:type VI secretion system secreted protein Hcp
MATDVFAKIGDVKGESQDDRHKDEIEVQSWSWGMSHQSLQAVGSGATTGRASFADLAFTHRLDKASPLLMKACATGDHFREAIITARKSGGGQREFLIIKMSDVTITSVAPSGTADNPAVMESVSLQFAKVDLEYKAQNPDGSLQAGTRFAFDIGANRVI